MGLSKTGVDLESVPELDDRLLVLAKLVVLVAARQVGVFSRGGVASSPCLKSKNI